MSYGIESAKTITLTVEKSQFLGFVFPIDSPDEVRAQLAELKKRHPSARHFCYAYRLGISSHSSDDGEPSGTAGRPLLELLAKKDIDHVLLVVVRYFGGTKLGAGRLLRTYVDAGNQTLALCRLGRFETHLGGRIALPYGQLDEFKRSVRDFHATLEDFVYNEKVEATLWGSLDTWTGLQSLFPSMEKKSLLPSKPVLCFKED